MLDECKGEKLEEVLISFSMAVLHKTLAMEKDGNSTIARRLVLASKLSRSDQKSMLPLAIAHRASLCTLLRRKQQLQERYDDFQKRLRDSREELERRKTRLEHDQKVNGGKVISEDAVQKAKKQLSLHWHGDPKWLDFLVEGGQRQPHDPLLKTSFEQTLKQITKGDLSKESAPEQEELLQDLETRLQLQEVRVRRWKQYRDQLATERRNLAATNSQSTASESKTGVRWDFKAHLELVMNSGNEHNSKCTENTGKHSPSESIEYRRLVSSLREELHDVDEPQRRKDPVLGRAQRTTSDADPMSKTFSTRKRGIDQGSMRLTMGNDPEWLPSETKSDEATLSWKLRTENASSSKEQQQLPESSESILPMDAQSDSCTSDQIIIGTSSKTNDTPNTEYDEEDLLAAEIVALTVNAAPSPVKGRPSLAERTRQSMSFTSSYHHPLDDSPWMQPPLPRISRSEISMKPAMTSNGNHTLLERTRQSMSLLPKEPRKPVPKHRLSKQFPINQFATPKKHSANSDVSEHTTPPEQLFSEEAEYASVFKSRPKIAMSPIPSPLAGMDSSVDDGDEEQV